VLIDSGANVIHLPDDHERRQSRRYPVVSPVQFRGIDGPWHEGTTVNIGAQGLLFRARVAMPAASELAVHIELPHGASGAAHVLCSGRVVRTEPGKDAGETLIAMTIEQFQLRRAEPDPFPRI
jgi:PilZ domain